MIFPNRAGQIVRRFLSHIHHQKRHSVDENEVSKFGRLAHQWWDENGFAGPLHSLNSLRVPLICNGLKNVGKISPENYSGSMPLQNIHILDVGCGGGILSESLARQGASVCGIDPAHESIEVALRHCTLDKRISDRLEYKCTTVEQLASEMPGKFDAVIASEVAEHVPDVQALINTCVSLLKPEGSIFLTTINRTWYSYLFTIFAAEYVLGIVPRGTHEWRKYITVEEMEYMVKNAGCHTRFVSGMDFNPFKNLWSWTGNKCANYALHAQKEKTEMQ